MATTTTTLLTLEHLPDLVMISIANSLDLKDLKSLRQVSKRMCELLDGVPSLWWKYRSRMACTPVLTTVKTIESAKYICTKFGFTQREVWIHSLDPYLEACRGGQYEVFKYLFETYGLPPLTDVLMDHIHLLILHANGSGNLDLVRYLFETVKIASIDRLALSYTIVPSAIFYGHFEVTKYVCGILNQVIQPQPTCCYEHDNAIHEMLAHAGRNGHLKQFEYLCELFPSIDRGCLINLLSSALFFAAEHGHVDIVRYIYNRHNFSAKDIISDSRRYQLFYACIKSRNLEMVKFLFETLKFSFKDSFSTPPIDWLKIFNETATQSTFEIFKYLVDDQIIPFFPYNDGHGNDNTVSYNETTTSDKIPNHQLGELCWKWAIQYPTLEALQYLFRVFNISYRYSISQFRRENFLLTTIWMGQLEAFKYLCTAWNVYPGDIKFSPCLFSPDGIPKPEMQVEVLDYICTTYKIDIETIGLAAGFNIFHEAAKSGHLPMLKYLCDKVGLTVSGGLISMNAIATIFKTALQQRHCEVVQFLHERFKITLMVSEPHNYENHDDDRPLTIQPPESFRVLNPELNGDQLFWINVHSDLVTNLATFNCVKLFQFLHEKVKFPKSFLQRKQREILRNAISSKSYEFLVYLCNTFNLTREDLGLDQHNGDTLTPALLNADIKMLDYLHQRFKFTIEDLRSRTFAALQNVSNHNQIKKLYWLEQHFPITIADLQSGDQTILRASLQNLNLPIIQFLYERKVFTRDYFTANNYRVLRRYGHWWKWDIKGIKYLAEYEFKLDEQELKAWKTAMIIHHEDACYYHRVCCCNAGMM